jgi:hypothetical protein
MATEKVDIRELLRQRMAELAIDSDKARVNHAAILSLAEALAWTIAPAQPHGGRFVEQ